MEDSEPKPSRFSRTKIYHAPTAVARGPRLKPGKLAERQVAHLRATGGTQVTRAASRRLFKETIKTTVPIIEAEEKPMRRRLVKRDKHVPANLKVSPAHMWMITEEALTKAVACFEVEASLISEVAWMLAEHAGRKSIRTKDFAMADTLIRKLADK
jgi:hypothetical protein